VLLALVLWLTSRTRWQPSAPLHLEHRRTWGAIVNASRRMYLEHLPVFLGVGLLFFPLGLLITGVQYLIFRVGALNGLVNSAGSTNAAAVILAVVSLTSVAVLLAVWLLVRRAFLAQVVVLEATFGLSALRRSGRLVRGNWWRVASMLLFVIVIAVLLGPLVGTLLLFVSSASFNFINLISGAVHVFVLPFAAIASTYLYFDLRVAKQYEEGSAEAADLLPVEAPSATAPGPT
jgi:hypothetical protein